MFCSLGHALQLWGTQGCQHVGLRKILVNSRRIPLWWGSSSQTPALWAATKTDCLLICLESLIFTPRIELHFTHTFPQQHPMITKPSLSFTQFLITK